MTAVKSYNYTTGAVSGNPGTTALGYTNDKLTTFGSKAITYNSNGGVASYDGWNYTWSNGKLSTIRMEYGGSARLPGGVTKPTLKNSKTYSYTYNAQGQRVKSTYSHLFNTDSIVSVDIGEVTAYTKIYSYDSFGRLISVSTTETLYGEGTVTSEIVFLYDQGSMVGMQYTSPTNGTNVYYYLRNLQGDVIGIYDTSGNLKVKYNYDAWGNCTVASETTSIALANVNPIRYRGYYYDTETKLYYLNARYYSPEWRRFISPDAAEYVDPETPNGLNLYAYCYNDPVNYADGSGHMPEWLEDVLNGLAVIAVAALIVTALTFTGGTAAAFLIAAGKTALLGLEIAAVAGVTSGTIRTGRSLAKNIGEGNSFSETMVNAGKSFLAGFGDGFFGGALYYAGSAVFSICGCYYLETINNGYGVTMPTYMIGYQNPSVLGFTFFASTRGNKFRIDLDPVHSFHYHYGDTSKERKIHRGSWLLGLIAGIGVGIFAGFNGEVY